MSYILPPRRFRAVTLTLGSEFKEIVEALIDEKIIPECDPYLKCIGYGLYLHQYPHIPSLLIDREDFTDGQLLLIQTMGLAMRTDFCRCGPTQFSQKLDQGLKSSLGAKTTEDVGALDTYLRRGLSYGSFCQKVTDPVVQGIFIFLYSLFDRATALALTNHDPLKALIVKSLGAGGLGWHEPDEWDGELASLADRLFRAWQGVY